MRKNKLNLLFWATIGWLLILFVWGLLVIGQVEAHETHLSDVGGQTVISTTPCPLLSGYVIESEERGCFLVYKHFDLLHVKLHVQDNFLRDKDGDCACPKHEEIK